MYSQRVWRTKEDLNDHGRKWFFQGLAEELDVERRDIFVQWDKYHIIQDKH